VATIKIQSIAKPERSTSKFTYTDLLLDLKLDYTKNNEFLRRKEIKDLQIDYDYAAVRNSIFNLFTTIPGQRILTPLFGLGLQKYLFLPVSETIAFNIGNDVLKGITTFEPRVRVQNINVAADEVNQQYVITLNVSILTIDVSSSFKLVGILSNTGFNFIN
jgi:phage baseplate assembly protein W